MSPSSHAVVIVGGGIAGLAAAYELHKQRVPFLLLEAGARTGGVILSERVGALTIDGGPDSLLVQKPEGIQLCRELGLGDRLVPTKLPRLSFIQRGGRLHPLPAGSVLGIPTSVGPFVRTSLFSWSGKLRMGAELFIPPKRNQDDESIGHFMRRRFGREATDFLAEPLLAGIHAGDVDRLSIEALFPRLTAAEREHGSLLRAFRRQPRAPSSAEGPFRSLPGGLSELTGALMSALPPADIRLNTAVDAIARANDEYKVRTSSGDVITARQLIVATPAYITSDLLKDALPAVAARCREIRYASAVTIAFAFRRDQVGHPLTGSGFVVPKVERTGILAASWLSSKWPERAPEDTALMRAFLGGTRDPEAIDRSDEGNVKIGLDALRPLLSITGPPETVRLYRWRDANAQHEVGHLARMAAIDRALESTPGLYVTGSGFRGVGIPDCIADARTVARRVALQPAASRIPNP